MNSIGVDSYITSFWSMDFVWEFIKAGLILLIGVWLINKICKISAVIFGQMNLDMGLISFLNSAFKLFLRIILGLLFLSALGINITSVMAALSASIVTAGILIKDSVSNFISGLLLIFNKPIRVGDYIEFENVKGQVMKIEMAFTTLKSPEGNSVIIPNFRLLSNNISRKSPYDICEYSFFVHIMDLNSKLDARKILDGVLLADKDVLQVPAPKVEYVKINENEIKLKIEIFCEKRAITALQRKLAENIKQTFKRLHAQATVDGNERSDA
jgi:Small-conductance mechanosensitive channel